MGCKMPKEITRFIIQCYIDEMVDNRATNMGDPKVRDDYTKAIKILHDIQLELGESIHA